MKYYEKAKEIATKAHEGQTRWDPSIPYITHPQAVADHFSDDTYKSVAILHDVIEDTNITLQDLEKEFPPIITKAIESLTHRSNESYADYIMRVGTNGVARMVKIKDIEHNLSTLPENDQTKTRLRRERYSLALIILRRLF